MVYIRVMVNMLCVYSILCETNAKLMNEGRAVYGSCVIYSLAFCVHYAHQFCVSEQRTKSNHENVNLVSVHEQFYNFQNPSGGINIFGGCFHSFCCRVLSSK